MVTTKEDKESANYVNLSDLSITTTSGGIIFNNYSGNDLNSLAINSSYGGLEAKVDLTVEENLEIYADSGRIRFKNLAVSSSTAISTLSINNVQFWANTLSTSVDLTLESGYFLIDEMVGDLSSNDSVKQMASAQINIKKINGNVSLPFANNSQVTISEVASGNQIYVHSTSGSVTIEKCSGKTFVQTTSGNVNIETSYSQTEVATESGNINVIYSSASIGNGLEFTSNSGNVNLTINPALAFILAVYGTNGELRPVGAVTIDWLGDNITNPITINEGTNTIKVITDKNVTINLIK
jgi:hypothetical protein